MFQDKYRRDIEAVGPGQDQLDRLMAALETRKAPAKKRVLRTVLIAAALCAALMVTALAVSPTLREALAQALGLFAPYSQEVEGVSATDQGIQVRVVSALSDGNVAQVYYEMQDLTGDRLDAFTNVDLIAPMPANWGEDGGVHWAGAGSTKIGGLISYDPETKTALMVGAVLGNGPPAEKLVLDMDISQIKPGSRHEEPAIDPAWISKETLKTLTLPNGKVVLAPEQNPRELEDSEFFSLSSYGFGEDGVLHLLVKVRADDSQWEHKACTVRYTGGTSISDTPPYYPRTNRYHQSTSYKGMTEEEIELADPEACFEYEGVTYYDCRTGITPADVAEGDVEWNKKFSAFLNTRPIIRGEWDLTVPVEMVEKISIDMTGSQTVIADVAAQTLHLSVLGCTIESDPNGTAGSLNYILTVYLADGSTLSADRADGLFHAGRYAVNHWTFPEPVEPEEVTAIALGLWYVPIENGAAQPGHWLTEQP